MMPMHGLLSRLAIGLVTLACASAGHAATVTGDLRDITGQPLSIRITFRPELTPLFDGTQTVLDIPRSVWSINGAFTAELVGGWYTAEFGPYGKPIRIAVPQNPGTYSFQYCASLRTNVTAYYLPLTSLAAGWGILAETNQTLVTVSVDPNILVSGGQSPWAQDIDAAGHSLLNVGDLEVQGILHGSGAGISNVPVGGISPSGGLDGQVIKRIGGIVTWADDAVGGGGGSGAYVAAGDGIVVATNLPTYTISLDADIDVATITASGKIVAGPSAAYYGDGAGLTNLPLTALQSGGAQMGYTLQWDGSQWVPASANPQDLGYFDVTSYGATGDGVADDTDAIQAAIEAARSAGGGIVWFPPGVYMVSTNSAGWRGANGTPAALIITNVPAIELRGAGRDLSIIRLMPTLNVSRAPQGVIMLEHIGVSKVIVSDLTFDGNRTARGLTTSWSAYNEDDGYSVDGCDSLVIVRARVENVANDAFDLDNAKNVVVIDAEARNAGEAGFGFGGNCTNILLAGLRVYECGWLVQSPNADNAGVILHDVFNAQLSGLLLASNYVNLEIAGANNITVNGVTAIPKPGVVMTNIILAGNLAGVRLSDVVVRYEPGFGPVANTVGIWLGRRHFGGTQLYTPAAGVWIDGGFLHAYYPVLASEASDVRINDVQVLGFEGFYLTSVTNVMLRNNYVQASPSMRVLGQSREVDVVGNVFAVYAFGPEFSGPGPYRITGNTVRRHTDSTYPALRLAAGTSNAVVVANVISSNIGPFRLGGSNHVVRANTFHSGIALDGSEVQGNIIEDNVIGGSGVTVYSGSPSYALNRWLNNKRPDGQPIDLGTGLTRTTDAYLAGSIAPAALSTSGGAEGQVIKIVSGVPTWADGGGAGPAAPVSWKTNATPGAGSLGFQVPTTLAQNQPRRMHFVYQLAQNITTVLAPTVPAGAVLVDGDLMIWELIQDGSTPYTITGLAGSYKFGDDIPDLEAPSLGRRTFVSWVYSASDASWRCVGLVRNVQ